MKEMKTFYGTYGYYWQVSTFWYNELFQQEIAFEKYPALENYMPNLKVFTLLVLKLLYAT